MTVSTSTTFEFDIAGITRIAYRASGVLSIYQEPNSVQAGAARDELQLIVNGSQTEGLFARVMTTYVQPLATGIFAYPMPSSVFDVVGDAMFIPVGQSTTQGNGESLVSQAQRDEYQDLSAKGATGKPTRYFPDRTATVVTVKLWPIPSASENGANVRLQVQRYRADVRNPSNTVDYEKYWTDYLVSELGYRLARSAGILDRAGMLRAEADDKLAKCKSASKQRGSQQLRVGHRTSWSNR